MLGFAMARKVVRNSARGAVKSERGVWTIPQAAAELQISARTFEGWIQRGIVTEEDGLRPVGGVTRIVRSIMERRLIEGTFGPCKHRVDRYRRVRSRARSKRKKLH
jgi:hypothetical protein